MRVAHPHVLAEPTVPRGSTLAARLAAGVRLSASAVVGSLAPIADALDAAHRLGVVHGAVDLTSIVVTTMGDPLLVGLGDTGGDPSTDVRALGDVCAALAAACDEDAPQLAAVAERAMAGELTAASAFAAALRAAVGREPRQLVAPRSIRPSASRRSYRFRPLRARRGVRSGRKRRVGVVAAIVLAVPLAPIGPSVRSTTAPAAAPVAEFGGHRYRVGVAGDVVEVGDWDGDGAVTVKLYRPSTGETFVFDRWGDGVTAPARSRSR